MSSEIKQYHLNAEEELRIEIDDKQSTNQSTNQSNNQSANQVILILTSGTAEIFGTEITLNTEYKLNNQSINPSVNQSISQSINIPVFSWSGCDLSIKGPVKYCYVANDTPMLTYINTHAAINEMRRAAKSTSQPTNQSTNQSINQSKNQSINQRGPVVLVCGPSLSGKTSLCKTLCSWSVRQEWQPILIDLDSSSNCLTIPGSISASFIQAPIPVEPSCQIVNLAPLTYYYGHLSAAHNGTVATTHTTYVPPARTDLFKKLVKQMANVVRQRFESNEISRTSGALINTGNWIDGPGYELLIDIVRDFQVDVICVLAHDWLYSQLRSESRITVKHVIKLAKSQGVEAGANLVRQSARSQAIREYFYGAQRDLRPHTKTLKFTEMSIFRSGGGPVAPVSALPIGSVRLVDPDALTRLTPTADLLHSVMAVSYATEAAKTLAANTAAWDTEESRQLIKRLQGDILSSNVAGFVFLTNVDTKKNTITILCPAPGPLPSTCFIVGNIKWMD